MWKAWVYIVKRGTVTLPSHTRCVLYVNAFLARNKAQLFNLSRIDFISFIHVLIGIISTTNGDEDGIAKLMIVMRRTVDWSSQEIILYGSKSSILRKENCSTHHDDLGGRNPKIKELTRQWDSQDGEKIIYVLNKISITGVSVSELIIGRQEQLYTNALARFSLPGLLTAGAK